MLPNPVRSITNFAVLAAESRSVAPTRALTGLEPGAGGAQRGAAILAIVLAAGGCNGRGTDPYIHKTAPIVALSHVRVIDGSGQPGIDDQLLLIRDGRIAAVGPSGSARVPPEAQVLDLHG